MSSNSPPAPHPYVRPPRAGAVPLIAPRVLRQLLDGEGPPLLIDVRPLPERRLAHLPGDRHLPLEELVAGVASLPADRAIVLYDHLGFRARRAAEFLIDHGFGSVAALEGGIEEYARVVDPGLARYSGDERGSDLIVRQLPRPETGCLAYFVGDPVARVGVVIDPGQDTAPYQALLAEGDWKLAGIVETHTHADHLAGHSALHLTTDAPILVSHRSPAQYPHQRLTEGEAVRFGSQELVVLETPGHTQDHLTLRLRDQIFTGDTLLLGSCGRTDLAGGSPERLWESLQDRLLRLPRETEVYPAHYGPLHALPDRYVSTLGFERATNEALNQGSREAFLRYMTEGWPPKPARFDEIVASNLAA
ncbi:MAG: MBL fold metallo-hydrolase [Thermoplasmata archaeon]|nr:MBL fold metallo-hydrolase [Thermoplasmata archaeon]